MFETAKAIKRHDPAAHTLLEVILLYPGYHAVLLHRVAHALYQIHFYFLARVVSQLSRGLTGIEIHPGATIGKRLFIDHGMGTVIGESAVIGDDCVLYHGVTLGGRGEKHIKRHPTLGHRVLVGTGATILGNITLGDDVKVGANSVVLHDVPAQTTVVGNPAQILVRK